MKLLQFIHGPHNPYLFRALGRRHFAAASTEEYAKRNYASDEPGYYSAIGSLTKLRRYFLLRDAYDDMVLDGVQPTRDIFHSLIVGTMKGSRLQDAFFFRDQMKALGLVPDVFLYNLLISTCGKCKNSDQAIRILEEMKMYEVTPNGQTYVCLLNACAAAGRLDRVYAIVRDMTAAGAGLNKFCYAGLIIAHVNKTQMTVDTASKIIEFVERSKGWSSVEASSDSAENVMMGVYEEELYNMPTAEYAHRRGGFLNRQLIVYHAAFHACAELRNAEAVKTLLEMLWTDGKSPDVFILLQTMRCYLHCGDLDRALQIFDDYERSGKPPMIEFFVTLAEGAMVGHTPRGMQVACDALAKMNSIGFNLNPKMGSDLLLMASQEKTGGFTTANYIWDLMQGRKMIPSLPAVQAYYNGLKVSDIDTSSMVPTFLKMPCIIIDEEERAIPGDDPRLLLVSRTYDNLRLRLPGPGPGQP